jgi:zinc transporter ZupT
MLPIVLSKHFLLMTGMILILIAYFFQRSNWMNIKGFLYNFVNTFAAGLLTYVAFQPFQLEFFSIAALWTLISLIRLYKSFK